MYSPRSKMFFERLEIKASIGILLHLFSDFEDQILENENEWFQDMVSYYESCLDIAYELMDEDPLLEDWVSHRMKELAELKGNTDYAFTRLLYQMFSFSYFKTIMDTDLASGVADQRSIRNLAILTNILTKFESNERIEVISSERKINVLKKLFNTYFRFLMKGGITEYQDESEYAPSGCVSFMTIHQSKGMEFPIVIVDSLYDSPIQDKHSILDLVKEKYAVVKKYEPEDAIKYYDFWRRYYVAFSRAQSLLILTTPVKASGHTQSPSKYFSTAWDDILEYNKDVDTFKDISFQTIKQSELKQSYAFTSDIERYEQCAIEYKMFRELGFSEVRIGSTMFGSLVHQTIEDIHDAILDNRQQFIPENIDNWFEQNYQSLVLTQHSYLAPSAKAAALRCIKNYYKNSKDMWGQLLEAEVKLSYPMENYILNGQIDMLDGSNGTVEIVDFKTGKKPDDLETDIIKTYEKQLQVYARLVERKYDVNVSKMKLYYVGENENPIIIFNKDDKKIDGMMYEFSRIVEKIEKHDFSAKSKNIQRCLECDMRYYCGRVNAKK